MKIYNNCPVCKKESKIEIKARIPINSGDELTDIENDEIFFKLTNHQEKERLLSICMNCRLVYNKMFYDYDEIGYIYTKGYYLMEERIKHLPGFVYSDENFLNSYSKRIYEKVKLIESKEMTKITHIYDIGGRDGFMLKDLAENGYHCTVFDPMPREPYTKKIKKVNVWASQVDAQESADLILLCDVLSHCIDPKKEVERCKHLLKDNGFLYIEVPYDIGIFFGGFLLING